MRGLKNLAAGTFIQHIYHFDTLDGGLYQVLKNLIYSIPEDLQPNEASTVYDKYQEFAVQLGLFKKHVSRKEGKGFVFEPKSEEVFAVLRQSAFECSREPPKKVKTVPDQVDFFECKIATRLPINPEEYHFRFVHFFICSFDAFNEDPLNFKPSKKTKPKPEVIDLDADEDESSSKDSFGTYEQVKNPTQRGCLVRDDFLKKNVHINLSQMAGDVGASKAVFFNADLPTSFSSIDLQHADYATKAAVSADSFVEEVYDGLVSLFLVHSFLGMLAIMSGKNGHALIWGTLQQTVLLYDLGMISLKDNIGLSHVQHCTVNCLGTHLFLFFLICRIIQKNAKRVWFVELGVLCPVYFWEPIV